MKYVLFLLFVIITLPAFAQEQTLIGAGDIENGGFGGPVVKVSGINGESAVLVGGRGGWIINHTFVLGGAGYGLVTNVNAKKLILFINSYKWDTAVWILSILHHPTILFIFP